MANENVKKFVNSLDKGNNDQAGTDVKNALGDKVSTALDDRKVDVAKTLFQQPAEKVPSDNENAQ